MSVVIRRYRLGRCAAQSREIIDAPFAAWFAFCRRHVACRRLDRGAHRGPGSCTASPVARTQAAAAAADQALPAGRGHAAGAVQRCELSSPSASSLPTSPRNKDRAALANLVVAQNFFWIQDKDLADKNKSGIDNLAKAIDLDAKDGSGWDTCSAARQRADRAGNCRSRKASSARRPIRPSIRRPSRRSARRPQPTRPNGAIRSMTASKCMPRRSRIRRSSRSSAWFWCACCRTAASRTQIEPPLLHVATPSGKSGYIDAETLAPLGGDQMCYTKDAGGWKIAGYFGGVSPQ